MIFNLVGGKDLTSLNIITGSVISGYEKPGTILVITDVPCPKVIYQTDMPAESDLENGTIWITHGTQVNVPPQILLEPDKNYYLYPVKAQQFIDGQWEDKQRYIYDSTGSPQSNNYYIMSNFALNKNYEWPSRWNQTYPETTHIPETNSYGIPMAYNGGRFYLSDQWGYYVSGEVTAIRKIDVENYNKMVVFATYTNKICQIYCGDSSVIWEHGEIGPKSIDLTDMSGLQTIRIRLSYSGNTVDAPQLEISSWHFE